MAETLSRTTAHKELSAHTARTTMRAMAGQGTAGRSELARRALDGYEHGPDAPQRATAEAWARADGADVVVVVEGISDQIAVETAAASRGRSLAADGVVV